MKLDRFEDIKAWQLAESLVLRVYKIDFKTSYGIDLGFKVRYRGLLYL